MGRGGSFSLHDGPSTSVRTLVILDRHTIVNTTTIVVLMTITIRLIITIFISVFSLHGGRVSVVPNHLCYQ